jgi:hypothetical protein
MCNSPIPALQRPHTRLAWGGKGLAQYIDSTSKSANSPKHASACSRPVLLHSRSIANIRLAVLPPALRRKRSRVIKPPPPLGLQTTAGSCRACHLVSYSRQNQATHTGARRPLTVPVLSTMTAQLKTETISPPSKKKQLHRAHATAPLPGQWQPGCC